MLNQTPLGQIIRRKSSVDAHGLSSHIGCSRILWHLISFLNHQRTPTVLAEKANRQMTTQLQRRTDKQIEHTRSFVWDACPIQLNKWLQANPTWTVVRTSRAQSDEGCRRNLFNISRKKGVGYLRVVIAVSSQNYCKYKQKGYGYLNTTEVAATQGRNTQSVTHQCSIEHHLDRSPGESPQSTRMVYLHI